MHFYTSINNAYLPKARVLAKSVKEMCIDSFFTLVLSDGFAEGFNLKDEPFDEVITIDELGIDKETFNYWVYIHSVVELCTAVKGQALYNLLQRSDKVVYLDPDIVVYDDMEELNSLLDTYDIVLTPHQSAPETTEEGVLDNEICSLKHGTYNFGFFAARNTENGLKFAKWFRDRLIDHCFDDIPNGIFTDQKWGDLVPAYFDGVYIWRNPGCNVSTWNLTNRIVEKTPKGTYLVNGFPLQFYHFSGFDSGAQKAMLDKYSNNNPVLYEMRDWYIQRMEEEGQEAFGKKQSIFATYSNGEIITKEQRTELRTRLDLVNAFSHTNPFDTNPTGFVVSYYDWYKDEHKSKDDINGKTYDIEQINNRSFFKRLLLLLLRAFRHLFKYGPVSATKATIKKIRWFLVDKNSVGRSDTVMQQKKVHNEPLIPSFEGRIYNELMPRLSEGEKLIVVFSHSWGGGAKIALETRIIRDWADRNVVVLSDCGHAYYAEHFHNGVSFNKNAFYDIDNALEILSSMTDEIWINEIISFDNLYEVIKKILYFKKKSNAQMFFLVNDLYCVCPKAFCMGEDNTFCGLLDEIKCNKCFSNARNTTTALCGKSWTDIYGEFQTNVAEYRAQWYSLISECKEIVCFSENTAKLMTKVYDNLPKIVVQPHENHVLREITTPKEDGILTIGLLGNLQLHKGSDIIKKAVELATLKKKGLRFVLIGNTLDVDESARFIKTGEYDWKDIPKIAEQYSVDAFFVSSVIPETFSYTAREAISTGIPVFSFDIGAQSDVVKSYEKGHIISSFSVEDVINSFYSVIESY